MIPHCSTAANPLCITTAAMDGSVNDRATKRQRGVRSEHTNNQCDEGISRSSNHTVSTSSSTRSGNTTTSSEVPRRPSKHVSFAPITAIHGSDWTQEEVDAGWYSKDELSEFKQERKSLVKVLKRVQFDLSQIDTTLHCLRGYEAYFSIQANKEYKFKRQMVWKAVLHEQARQRHQGRTDSMMMQLVSSHATQWARDTATELGMQDAQVALSIFLEYMREQEEDDLEEYVESDEGEGDDDDDDFDDAPIAVNWNEPLQEEDFSACLDFSMPQDGLELSLSGTATTMTMMMTEPNNVSFSSHQSSTTQDEGSNYHDNNNDNNSGWIVPQQQQLTLDNAEYNHHHYYNTNTDRRVS